MKIDRDQVRRVARLARLDLPEKRLSPLARDLETILDHFSVLEAIDVDGVEVSGAAAGSPGSDRSDQARPGLDASVALQPSADADPPFFRVPGVLDAGGRGPTNS